LRFDDASTSTLLFIIVVIEGFVNIFTGVLERFLCLFFLASRHFFPVFYAKAQAAMVMSLVD